MSISTSQIPLVSAHNCASHRSSRAPLPCESWYSLVGKSAGPVEKHSLVHICHHLLTADAQIASMPPMPFGGGLTQLIAGTAAKQEKQSTQNNGQSKLTRKDKDALHHFSFSYRPAGVFAIWPAQNTPVITISLYKLPELLSTKKLTHFGMSRD